MAIIWHVDAGYGEAEAFVKKACVRIAMWEICHFDGSDSRDCLECFAPDRYQ